MFIPRSRRKKHPAGRLLLCLVSLFWLAALTGCSRTWTDSCRIGMAGEGPNADKLEEALLRLGERPERVALEARPDLAAFDLLIFAEGALSERTAGFAQLQPAIAAFVKNGGGLLVFGLQQEGYKPEFLPHEVRFADDSSGWGSYDFSDDITRPAHPLFNIPHRLTYLAGLEETDRIAFTGPEWKVLLAKDPRHPEFDYSLTNPDFTVGSIFEAAWGRGHVLVCQPIVERYYAEGLQMAPHPLEQGVLLFENIVEYMKSMAKGRRLPIARAQAVPSHGPTGAAYLFRASVDGADGKIEVNWDFGDGGRGEGLNCAHVYSRCGVYIAAATVRTARGADRATCRVEVREPRPMRWGEHLIDAFTSRYYPDPGRVGVNYRTSLVLNGMLDVYKRNSDPAVLQYVESFFERRLISRWAERPYRGNLQPDHNFVDVYSMAAPAWRLYRITGKREYLSAATDLWEQSLTVDSQLPPGSLWSPYDWHGRRAIVDFTYFKAHLRSVAWECTGRLELLDEAARQMIRFRDVFQDPSDSLFFMAVDLDHQAYFTSPDRPSGLNDSKWGRANGWVALALAELLARLPADHPDRPELVEISRTFAAGLARAQDPRTGLWALIVDKRDYPGMWLETTSSSMFIYALCRLVECGVLPADPFLGVARRGYNGLQQKIGFGAFDYPYISDACEGTLPRPNLERWTQAHRHDNDFHVLGPYLMAEEVLWRMAPPEVAVVGCLRSSGSDLGMILNSGGFYFYQIPSLYTLDEPARFSTVIVDRHALDRNDADVRAYYGKLLERSAKGATLVFLPQDDLAFLQQVLPRGLSFSAGPGTTTVISHDATWKPAGTGSPIYEKKTGAGCVIYCAGADNSNLAALLRSL